MSRLKRRNRTDLALKSSGGILDLMNNAIKSFWRINDEEFDHLCNLGDEIINDALIREDLSISEAKQALHLINKALEKYYLIKCQEEKEDSEEKI